MNSSSSLSTSPLLRAAARQRAERLWHPARIAGMVAEVYRQAMERGDQDPYSPPSLR